MEEEIERRRTFAIISHPDAGKTTLTEKLLLFSGAIQIAGSIKARKTSRHATADWMEIEKQRGISVASSVMQFVYRDKVINLLDTPGHQDFSEDTYRVLTAVNAALMVIDAAHGIEAQTLRLLKICRSRNIPIITFINKMDREVRGPFDLLEDVEKELGMTAIPMTWPIGMGNRFRGVYDRINHKIRYFRAGTDRLDKETRWLEPHRKEHTELLGEEWDAIQEDLNLLEDASPVFERSEFITAQQTPVFFGSAINNFGVQELLDSVVDFIPSPGPQKAEQRIVNPLETAFSGIVFKVQANMDPNHRDRVAFVRICSGQFERGMPVTNTRTGKTIRPQTVVTFLSQRRDLVDNAWPGDIIGIPNHGSISLGDTLTQGELLQFSGLPFFAPELFRAVEAIDPMKAKQLNSALQQLGDEGAIQVFRQENDNRILLGAVGELQFDVVSHRLEHEYRVQARISSSPYTSARWITAKNEQELKKFIAQNSSRIAWDASKNVAFLAKTTHEITVAEEHWPDVRFSLMRERGGELIRLKK